MLKEDTAHEEAVLLVKREVEQYKKRMEQNGTRYKIVEEMDQPDGSVLMKIIKQYNSSPVGSYLD